MANYRLANEDGLTSFAQEVENEKLGDWAGESAFVEIDLAHRDFDAIADRYVAEGADPAVVAALYPMLTSDQPAYVQAAQRWIDQNRTAVEGPRSEHEQRDHDRLVGTARELVKAHDFAPTPREITRRYAPKDDAINDSLDRRNPSAHARSSKDKRAAATHDPAMRVARNALLGTPKTRDFSNATPAPGKRTSGFGKIHPGVTAEWSED